MSPSERGRSPAPFLDRPMLVFLFVSAAIGAAYFAWAASGRPMPPAPLSSMVFLAITTTITIWKLKRLDDKIDRRTARIHSALVQQGVTLTEVTGEFPQIHLPPRPSPGPRDEELDNVRAFELGRQAERNARRRRE